MGIETLTTVIEITINNAIKTEEEMSKIGRGWDRRELAKQVAKDILETTSEIPKAVDYFDEQVGHFTDSQKVTKLREEVNELDG